MLRPVAVGQLAWWALPAPKDPGSNPVLKIKSPGIANLKILAQTYLHNTNLKFTSVR